jgi:hypothetical protein
MADKVIYWSKTALTGGAAGALDSIDGTGLQDGEVAHVWVSNVLYIYLLDVDSAAAESSPAIIAPDTNAGDKRWILQSYYSGSGTLYTDHIAESTAAHGVAIDGLTIKDSGFAVGSDADGDMYYRASSKLARLAKGTADYKLFMNAAGTAPQWANGMKVIMTTRALDGATADVAYTGVGFKPSGLVAIATIDGADKLSVGFYGGGVNACIGQYGAITYQANIGFLIIYDNAPDKYQTASVKSFDADGLTVTWTRGPGGSAAGTIKFALMCFR